MGFARCPCCGADTSLELNRRCDDCGYIYCCHCEERGYTKYSMSCPQCNSPNWHEFQTIEQLDQLIHGKERERLQKEKEERERENQARKRAAEENERSAKIKADIEKAGGGFKGALKHDLGIFYYAIAALFWVIKKLCLVMIFIILIILILWLLDMGK